ncbi:hypothetical protein Glove_259g35 [Diversispora epigaea]|uniref:Uncharacterized protein n=1 Tax=Diversispora epigaea TaxID=1348612 RepID=A0A397IC32_9GLOM|nr:hypothetical protein Glove_259g35 [Diversispora epigaea]
MTDIREMVHSLIDEYSNCYHLNGYSNDHGHNNSRGGNGDNRDNKNIKNNIII